MDGFVLSSELKLLNKCIIINNKEKEQVILGCFQHPLKLINIIRTDKIFILAPTYLTALSNETWMPGEKSAFPFIQFCFYKTYAKLPAMY